MTPAALVLVLSSLVLLPLAGTRAQRDADLAGRLHLAAAIVAADTTPHEQRILMRLVRFEASYDPRVYDCRVTGDGGRSVGPFQAHDRSPVVRERICTDLVYAARVARDDVRRSFAMARDLPVEERLAPYCRGGAYRSEEARRMARVRYSP